MDQLPANPDNNVWYPINNRKWGFWFNNLLLATIFHKPNNKFSLWFKTPMIYQIDGVITSQTYQYDSFDEAAKNFDILLRQHAEQWCKTVIEYLNSK